ncbi:MAG: histidine phosphatase family protein [Flammeovirgaceae bacterium]|nr:histidine phosphatase family protein [Flammeovirgaceae bacterium]MBR09727.1 histidine phosphatase family protein [Rickettsiales bacterium]MBR11459.1 histidine phosphatase family protein [Rickettsiales bacterium]HCX23432.1 histidine phosphatase family protein [Cytophagales bacterium]
MTLNLHSLCLPPNSSKTKGLKKFYIVRHGETEYNRKGMVQGSGINAPLNDTGQQQANAFYNRYKDIAFDKIYVSNLIRTEQSVQQFIDLGIPFEALEDLREISWGKQEGVAFTPETSTVYQQTTKRWSEGEVNVRIEGGETPVEVAERQQKAFDYMLSKPDEEEQTILVCIHGRAIRILLCWMLNYPLSYMDNFPHNNLGLYVVNHAGDQYSIEVFNEVSHLS